MKYFAALVFILCAGIANGQQENEALEGKYPLNDRYQLLKSKSQNYKEYKVIRESVLDNFWKIVRDSVAAKEAAIGTRDQNIKRLNTELSSTQATLKEKENSMEQVVHASTHISVLGIDFSKGVFITTVMIIIAVLILLALLMSGRLKMVHSSMKERMDAFNSLNNEFEEYKRKAMEKQTKLSRELQNERNKLSESRGI
jgi:predicted  nucleic acid-binding Zn-ribbon protein